ncbi:MAG: RecX family transcriptional regulator, partial [Nitrospinae bacterium]|nr:RecX family transcriptional regulator [Nitrospinota bacterium]
MPDPEALKRAKNQALRYLSYRDRSKWEITQYLEKKEHPHSVIQQTLEYLKELHYVDDQRFALQWGQYKINKKKLEKKLLYLELLNKGI